MYLVWVSDVNMTKLNKLIEMLPNEAQFFLYSGRAAKISFSILRECHQPQPEETLVYKFVSKILLSNLIK